MVTEEYNWINSASKAKKENWQNFSLYEKEIYCIIVVPTISHSCPLLFDVFMNCKFYSFHSKIRSALQYLHNIGFWLMKQPDFFWRKSSGIYVCVFVCMSLGTCVHSVYKCVCVCVCKHVFVYIWMCVCVCVFNGGTRKQILFCDFKPNEV